jgi:hypothetical protein
MPTGGIGTGSPGGGFSIGKIFQSPAFIPAMIGITSGLKAASSWMQGDAAVASAGRQQQAAEFQARQLEVNAGQAKAASQRNAYFEQLKGEQLVSAIKARAGAGASDPSVLNIIAQSMERQAYNMEAALYAGKDKARGMRMQAKAARYQGQLAMADAKAAKRAYRAQAFGHILGGMAQAGLHSKYFASDKVDEPLPALGRGGWSWEAGADPDLEYGIR